MVSSVTSTPATTSGTATSASSASTSAQTQSQNFLKLLVAQLNNQDPMNPMDNAQMTSQIAQINTVSGIQQLNTTMSSMASQFTAMQVMQGSSLIGRSVEVSGNTLSATSTGTAQAAFSLPTGAANVSVQIKSPGGQLLDTLQLGAQNAGVNTFTWPNASSYTGTGAPTFTVTATNNGTAVTATPLVLDTVKSVGTDASGAMTLTLQSGNSVPYSSVQQVF